MSLLEETNPRRQRVSRLMLIFKKAAKDIIYNSKMHRTPFVPLSAKLLTKSNLVSEIPKFTTPNLLHQPKIANTSVRRIPRIISLVQEDTPPCIQQAQDTVSYVDPNIKLEMLKGKKGKHATEYEKEKKKRIQSSISSPVRERSVSPTRIPTQEWHPIDLQYPYHPESISRSSDNIAPASAKKKSSYKRKSRRTTSLSPVRTRKKKHKAVCHDDVDFKKNPFALLEHQDGEPFPQTSPMAERFFRHHEKLNKNSVSRALFQ